MQRDSTSTWETTASTTWTWIPPICATLDISPIYAYVFHQATTKYYLLTLTAKLFVVIVNRLPATARLQRVWPFLCFIALIALFDLAFLDAPTFDVIQLLAFTVQMGLTIILVRPEQLKSYLATIGFLILANLIIYLFLVHSGKIDQHYGRFFYLGDSHPNLGSEIAATGIICAAAGLDGPIFLVALVVETLSIELMQGRSALLAAAGVAAVMALKQTAHLTHRYRFGAIAAILAVLAAAIMVIQPLQAAIWDFVSQSLLLNDSYRGAGSGFTGRTQGWHDAEAAFLRSPIVGVGVGYFDNQLIWPPHNMVLFLAAQFGVFGLPVVCMIFYKYYRLFRTDRLTFFLWLQFAPLLFFNDRLMNLNPYPYVFYVVLLAV